MTSTVKGDVGKKECKFPLHDFGVFFSQIAQAYFSSS